MACFTLLEPFSGKNACNIDMPHAWEEMQPHETTTATQQITAAILFYSETFVLQVTDVSWHRDVAAACQHKSHVICVSLAALLQPQNMKDSTCKNLHFTLSNKQSKWEHTKCSVYAQTTTKQGQIYSAIYARYQLQEDNAGCPKTCTSPFPFTTIESLNLFRYTTHPYSH